MVRSQYVANAKPPKKPIGKAYHRADAAEWMNSSGTAIGSQPSVAIHSSLPSGRRLQRKP